jgi:histidine triad (HIT) family protein
MTAPHPDDILGQLAEIIERRKVGDPQTSYVAQLLSRGEDAVLKKIGEEATEAVMAGKGSDRLAIVREMADLWFHCAIALAYYGLGPADVLMELRRREGISGIDEKAARRKHGKERGIEMTSSVTSENCIFCKIVRGEIPAKKFHEDDDVLVFHDIRPVAPVHFLLISKRHIPSLYECEPDDAAVLGKLLALVPRLAREQGANDGFRTIINTGRVGRQEVYHLHIHVIGGSSVLGPMITR